MALCWVVQTRIGGSKTSVDGGNKIKQSKWAAFAVFANPPLAGAASLSFQYWGRECNCWFFFVSTKFNGLIIQYGICYII